MRVVATAGHVDHGKSSLVLALTGTDPDRFPEEKARGLTIDLGFAFTTLPSGAEIGFVDVPGHVRFIKNMLAGVGAVDVALLVVDASECWKPQSEEHLRILELLDVRHGMVALTKADLVDDETLELAALEVDDHLTGSSLEGAPVIVCDSLSGRGIEDVRTTLDRVLNEAPAVADVGRPRLWIDRVFTVRGAGTVVTGTLIGGMLSVDDEVIAGRHRSRVRGIESAGEQVTTVSPGARVALNLAGIEHRDLTRGDAVVRPSQWVTPRVVDVAITQLPGEQMRRRGRFQVYVGSGEHKAWLRVLDDDGQLARVRLDEPVPLAPGDRFVVRDSGRKCTVAGAEVLDVEPAARARDAVHRLRLPLGARVLSSHLWLPIIDVPQLTGTSADAAAEIINALVAAGDAVRLDHWVISSAHLELLRSTTRERVQDHHDARPHEGGIELGTVANELRITTDQLRAALADAEDLVVERGRVRSQSHGGGVADSPDAERLIAALEAEPFSPPAPADVGVDQGVVRALVREGTLVDVDHVVFTATALDQARHVVIDAFRERGRLTVADIRDLLGSTRKYVLPIAKWLDREGITRRRGDDRVPGPRSGLSELL
ncbi:MAG: selenocysteine-specific translation elongation factor [Actinobacteria bacterium]|nr:selenocysteine-specific translation elongation factor [Actinomycetota bacterium]